MVEKVGTPERAKFTDIVVVDGDPLRDIRVLQDMERIKMVLKGGRVVVDRRV